QPVALEHDVAVALLVECELILKARAAAAANAHAKPGEAHVCVLPGQELLNLLGALVADRDHPSAPLAAFKTFQSIAAPDRPRRRPRRGAHDPLRLGTCPRPRTSKSESRQRSPAPVRRSRTRPAGGTAFAPPPPPPRAL